MDEHCHYSYPDSPDVFRLPQNVYVTATPGENFNSTGIIYNTAREYNHRLVHHWVHDHGFIVKHHHSHTDIRFFHEELEKNHSMHIASFTYYFYTVSYQPNEKLQPTPEFRLVLLLLPMQYDAKKYRAFIDDFGTHYVNQATMGAMALSTTFFHSCFSDIWSGYEVMDFVQSSFLGLCGKSSGHAHGYNETLALFRNYSQTIVKLVGGDAARHGAMTYDTNGQPQTMSIKDQQAWIQSVAKGNRLVPVDFTLSPIMDLIDNPVKRAHVNRTIFEYVGEVADDIESLVVSITPIDPWKAPKWCKWVPPSLRPKWPPH